MSNVDACAFSEMRHKHTLAQSPSAQLPLPRPCRRTCAVVAEIQEPPT